MQEIKAYSQRLSLGRRSFLHASVATLVVGGRAALLSGDDPTQVLSTQAVPPIAERFRVLEEGAPLTMQFRGKTADEGRRWQAAFGIKLRELLGPHRPPTSWKCGLERRIELADHVREERVLSAPDCAPVPFYLLLPRSDASAVAAKRPGILAIHGHGDFGHDSIAGIADTAERKAEIDKFKYDYGLKLVEQGYVVAAPCLTPFGRRLGTGKIKGGDPCTLVNLQLQHLGKLLIAENLRDSLWTLDFLAKHASVDAERLGCVGLSYGGRMTTLAMALDSRIRVAVVGGAMNTFQERAMQGSTSGCQVIPGLLNYGDMPEVAALFAPRPCVWTVGEKDRLLDPEWVEKFRERQARVYAAFDAADQLYVDRFAGGHEWHGEIAYRVLEKAFKT